jgi:hypothetical protein
LTDRQLIVHRQKEFGFPEKTKNLVPGFGDTAFTPKNPFNRCHAVLLILKKERSFSTRLRDVLVKEPF